MGLLELEEELGVVLDFVVDMLLAPRVLLATKGRGVLQVDAAVLAVEVRH